MSLLLDALKEAGEHRKAVEQSVPEKAELPDVELELDLNLDDENGSATDEHPNKMDSGGADTPDLSNSGESDTEPMLIEATAAKLKTSTDNDFVQQGEQAANAVFRNRAGRKLELSKFIILLGLLLIFAFSAVGYFFWTQSSVDTFEKRAKVLENKVEIEIPVVTKVQDAEFVVENSMGEKLEDKIKKRELRQGAKIIDDHAGGVMPVIAQGNDSQLERDLQQKDDEKVNITQSTHSSGSSFGEIGIRKRHIPNEIRKSLFMARRALEDGEWQLAENSFRRVLIKSPENVEAIIGMANVMMIEGKEEIARSLYLSALKKAPGNLSASVGLLNIKSDKASLEHGGKLKELLNEHPDQAFLHANLGDYYASRREWPAAQAAYFEAFTQNPTNADYAFNLAVCLDQMGKGVIALRYYKQALILKNKSAGRFDRELLLQRISELTGGGQ